VPALAEPVLAAVLNDCLARFCLPQSQQNLFFAISQRIFHFQRTTKTARSQLQSGSDPSLLVHTLFLRPEPRDGYAFSRGVEWNRSSERIHFKGVWGRCGVFTPLGRVAENLEGSKRGRDAEAPLPADRRERLAAECCGLEDGLSWEGKAGLLECLFYGAINIRVLISLGAVDEGGSRGMDPDGIANLELGYASLQPVCGIGKVCFVALALSWARDERRPLRRPSPPSHRRCCHLDHESPGPIPHIYAQPAPRWT